VYKKDFRAAEPISNPIREPASTIHYSHSINSEPPAFLCINRKIMTSILSITIIVASAVWIALLFVIFFGKLFLHLFSWTTHHTKRWINSAIEAEAIILSIEQTGFYVNEKRQVRLQVQVKPLKGRNFVTEINELEQPGLKEGATIKVKYNPRNYRDLLLIAAA
jgi:hypothetical protein